MAYVAIGRDAMPGNGDELDKRIAHWESQLIDLSMRNRLLNFKMSKGNNIIVKDADLKRLFNELVVEKGVFGLYCEKFRDDFKETDAGGRECELYHYVHLVSQKEAPSTLNPNTEKALTNLRLKSRTFKREQGVDVIYIAFGSLQWKDETKPNETYTAPLVLVPVRLNKKGLIAPHTVEMQGDDIALNPALALKVKREMNVDLPPIPDDLERFDVIGYINSLAGILTKRQGWSVSVGQPVIGLFAFTKVSMHQDMKANQQAIRKHPLLRALGGDRSQVPSYPDAGPPSELDPLKTYSVLEADSSQQEAVEAVKRGESLVLIGPPGTGKSQTITNIIAESLAAGRSVLFVSEKMAALEVVKKRLDLCGLGDFCLELHSTTPVKQEVVNSLLQPLDRADMVAEPGEELKLNQLRTVRDELNKYAMELHKRQGGVQRSAYEAYGEMAFLNDQNQLVFDLKDPFSMSAEAYSRAEASVQRLISLRTVISQRETHPWRDCDLKDLGPAQQADLVVCLQDISNDIARLNEISDDLNKRAELPVPATLEAMRRFVALLSASANTPRPPRHWFDRYELAKLIQTAAELRTARGEVSSGEAYIGSRYKRDFLNFDGKAYAERFEQRYAGPLRFLNSNYRKDMQVLRSFALDTKLSYPQAMADLKVLRNAQKAKALVADADLNGAKWFGRYYQRAATDHDSLMNALRWTESYIAIPGYHAGWASVAGEGSDLTDLTFKYGAEAYARMSGFDSALNILRGSFLDGMRWIDNGIAPLQLKDFADRHVQSKDRLAEWVEFLSTQRIMRQDGLGPFFDEVLKRQPDLNQLPTMFHKRFWQLWFQELHQRNVVLARFNSSEQADRVRRYRQLDLEQNLIARNRLKKILLANIRARRSVDPKWRDEEGYVRSLAGRKAKPAVREMLSRCPSVLRSAKPCMLMSPISVSQFLPPVGNDGPTFDLVVFDEASQIVPEDAINCIVRGKQLVVVGDNKQLPPTRFFDRLVSGDDEESTEDLESILDECATIGLRQKMLLWHYRSRQESLIAFSNYHLYGNRLNTFPSADPGKVDEGIELVFADDGMYDRGGRRDNRNEASLVADLVIKLFLAHPERSLGVVAFSQAQQQAIIDILDYKVKLASRERPALETFWDEECAEPFFVKNLENVQGDERDIMVFSVGYGKDEKGGMTMNFGPLNQEGGARRLNVAITRARRCIKVVSSIRSEDILVTPTTPLGVSLLRDYLDYAQAKGERVAITPRDMAASLGQEKFEAAIAQALQERGYQIVRRVGSSTIRVDIAVMDPLRPGHYLLGLLCDGASYMSGATARDREILREKVLKDLGWNTIRVWSRDWAMDRESTLARIDESVRLALAGKVQ